jgi:hypothetical protein
VGPTIAGTPGDPVAVSFGSVSLCDQPASPTIRSPIAAAVAAVTPLNIDQWYRGETGVREALRTLLTAAFETMMMAAAV